MDIKQSGGIDNVNEKLDVGANYTIKSDQKRRERERERVKKKEREGLR